MCVTVDWSEFGRVGMVVRYVVRPPKKSYPEFTQPILSTKTRRYELKGKTKKNIFTC